MKRRMLTTGQVAGALGVTINTVKAWIRAGRMEAIRLPSGHHRIPRRELERLRETRPSGLAALHRRRRRQWQVADAWAHAQPVEERSVEDALAWVASMLEVSERHGPLLEPDVEETVEGIRRLHAALSHVRG